jgi:uncharacterized membrane protein
MPEMLKLGLEDPAAARRDAGYQLDVGGVIAQTFSVTLANLLPFVLVGLIVYSPALLLHGIGALTPGRAVLFSLIATLVKSLLALVLTGALTFGVIRQLRGERASVGEIAQAGVESLGRVFVVSLLVGIVTMIGLLLCIVPGVIVMCMNWVAVPVAVIERPGIRASLERSHELTSGTRVAVFGVILVIGMIIGVMSVVATGGLTAAAAAITGGPMDGPVYSLTQLALTLVILPFECLQAASAAIGYHDLRVHREGADVEDLIRVFE